MTNIYELITTSKMCPTDMQQLTFTDASKIRYNFFFMPSGGVVNLYNNDETQYSQFSRATLLNTYSRPPIGNLNKTGNYTHSTPLDYIRVVNSGNRGVVSHELMLQGNTMITSGQLSGCMVCSVFFPFLGRTLFFHIGRDYEIDKKTMGEEDYTQQEKNRDLFWSMKSHFEMSDLFNYQYRPNGELNQKDYPISDAELLVRLHHMIGFLKSRVVIDIFISEYESNRTYSCFGRKHFQLTEDYNVITLRYYDSKAVFYATYAHCSDKARLWSTLYTECIDNMRDEHNELVYPCVHREEYQLIKK